MMCFRYLKTVLLRVLGCIGFAAVVIELIYVYQTGKATYAAIIINKIKGKGFRQSEIKAQPLVFNNTTTDLMTEKPGKVLLMTYLRSGSTLTADIVLLSQNIFYTYEPLKYLPKYERTYYRKFGSCFHNGTCREADAPKYRWDYAVEMMTKFYDCKLDQLPNTFFWHTDSSKSVAELRHCLKTSVSKTLCYDQAIKKCNNSMRVIKSIRLSMEIVETAMENISSLKVIHLLRDPRGILKSRLAGSFLPKWMSNKTIYANALCEQLHRDVKLGQVLKTRYPGRIKTLLYEYIAENPYAAAESIFKFLKTRPVEHYKEWIFNHTSAGKTSGYFETSRANSSDTASQWRKLMTITDVFAIDKQCGTVYANLGLLAIKNITHLRNLKIPIERKELGIGLFDV